MKRKRIRTHKFSTGVHKIEFERIYGLHLRPDRPGEIVPMSVSLDPSLKGCKFLDLALHEGLHAEGFEDEKVVDRTATNLAKFLWRLGYRRTER